MAEPALSFQALFKYAERDAGFRELLDACDRTAVNVHGPSDSLKAFLVLAAGAARKQPVCLIAADVLRARTLTELLEPMLGNGEQVALWKNRDFAWTAMDATGRETEHARIGTLFSLVQKQVRVLVMAAPGLLQPVPSPERFSDNCTQIDQGPAEGPDVLLKKLISTGYERVGRVEAPGQVARRGDIVDVVPIGLPGNRFGTGAGTGYRISFFDTDVDLIRTFDIASQRSLEKQTAVIIPPAREVLVAEHERTRLAGRIRSYAERRLQEMKAEGIALKVRNELSALCEKDAEAVAAGRDFPGLDRWLSYIDEPQTGILDYLLQTDALIFVDEPIRVRERTDAFAAEQIGQVRAYAAKGWSIPLAEKAVINAARPFQQLDRSGRAIALATIAVSGNGFPGARNIQIAGRDADSYRGREKQLIDTLRRRQNSGASTFITTASPERREKLKKLLADYETQAELLDADLPRGFEYPAIGLLVIGTRDLFGSDRRRKRRRAAAGIQGQRIDLFSDLQIGEAVVHEGYGIGRYDGLVNLESDGVRKDYLKLTYANEDVVYLPMKALDQIQKYVGTGGKMPKLSRLGGKDWSRLKERARNSIRRLATDLIALYAKRQSIKGYAFAPDSPWDKEFAAGFPYEETDDQLRCIREIKADMESDRVMDRLLCGDVGFGKTEVAFRAIFKCVTNGKQAALLAPTTVLTQQHYENFKERIADFPIRVGLLSRFAGQKEIAKTIRGIATGEVDVVIGTHRLLSKDVVFKDLGLLVVDEEQRFGVDHKEKLKNIRPEVDVLTLSATPIPRTLHMSMSGIRDISIIEEPPEDRRSVQTYVMEFDEAMITEGIVRELGRDGQVFYLFNDTRRIHEKADRIRAAIPGARVVVAHGKMPESRLEAVIESFVLGEADILVCTTIIESGIDMPNVNTIIVENADRMGLAQLYQLRGRVGRSGRQAYAYITYMRNRMISEEAAKRLTAIRDYTELGAGFRIALRDLEVRGAGNLLGGEQHGQMDAVGYDLYCRMLEDEVKQQQAAEAAAADEPAPVAEPLDTVIDIQLDAYLSPEYIPDEGERIEIYRKISFIRTADHYHDVIDELTDRYGDLPLQVINLADLSYIRAQANQSGFSKVSIRNNTALLTYGRQSHADLQRLSILMDLPAYKDRLVFSVAGPQPTVALRGLPNELPQIPAVLRRLFAELERAEAAERATAAH